MAAFQDMKKVALINFLNSLVNISVIFAAIIFHRYIVFLALVQVIFGILDLILIRNFRKKIYSQSAGFKINFLVLISIL